MHAIKSAAIDGTWNKCTRPTQIHAATKKTNAVDHNLDTISMAVFIIFGARI